MKVLITGGMGVIGAETSRKFVKEGHRPVIFARHRDDSLVGDILDKFDFEQGDVLDMPRILQAIKKHKVTHVVHAAAFVGAVSAGNPALSIQVNVMGLVNILEAARALSVQRVVFTSAKGVYGPVLGEYGSPTWKPMSEDLPAKPKRIYDSAKFMGENVCAYYNDNMGIETVSLRFASTYGPGKTARHGPMAVMSRIVENPAAGLPFELKQGGDDKDDFVYNKDSALGIYLAITADKIKSRVYNIGTGVGVTLRLRARHQEAHPERADGDRRRAQLLRLPLSRHRRLRHLARPRRTRLQAGVRSGKRHRGLSGGAEEDEGRGV